MKYRLPGSADTQEIYLKLEQYDDIFSDFDMRPYSSRSLSFDFLNEIKRAVDKNSKGIELVLHAPEKERNENDEATIKERLAAHFSRHYHLLLAEKRKVLRLGYGMVAVGVVSMILATHIIYEDPTDNLWLSFLVVFLEPAAWFLLWEGMDQIIFNSKNINPELDFYHKMSNSHAHVSFKSY